MINYTQVYYWNVMMWPHYVTTWLGFKIAMKPRSSGRVVRSKASPRAKPRCAKGAMKRWLGGVIDFFSSKSMKHVTNPGSNNYIYSFSQILTTVLGLGDFEVPLYSLGMWCLFPTLLKDSWETTWQAGLGGRKQSFRWAVFSSHSHGVEAAMALLEMVQAQNSILFQTP